MEHIVSGESGRFASAAELTAFIARIGGSTSATAGEHDAPIEEE